MNESISVIANDALETGPATAGMQRSQAFATDNLWFGEVHTRPGEVSGWHHHGEHTTHGYVVAGRVRFDFGPGGGSHVEAGPGEYFMVPSHAIHREQNPGSEEQVIVLVRTGTGPSVTNVDGPESA